MKIGAFVRSFAHQILLLLNAYIAHEGILPPAGDPALRPLPWHLLVDVHRCVGFHQQSWVMF